MEGCNNLHDNLLYFLSHRRSFLYTSVQLDPTLSFPKITIQNTSIAWVSSNVPDNPMIPCSHWSVRIVNYQHQSLCSIIPSTLTGGLTLAPSQVFSRKSVDIICGLAERLAIGNVVELLLNGALCDRCPAKRKD